MIDLHIDMKAAFIIHAIINRKSIKKSSSTHRMQRSVFEIGGMVLICPKN